jgi:uncharacterized protein (TIGR03066 family)
MRTAIVVAVCVCGSLGADEPKDEKIDAALLVGKWEPKAPKKGELTSVEFTKAGGLVALTDAGGKGARAEGTYKLQGAKLTYEVTSAGETTKETVTVRKLTGDELETLDKEGRIDAFRRVKPK